MCKIQWRLTKHWIHDKLEIETRTYKANQKPTEWLHIQKDRGKQETYPHLAIKKRQEMCSTFLTFPMCYHQLELLAGRTGWCVSSLHICCSPKQACSHCGLLRVPQFPPKREEGTMSKIKGSQWGSERQLPHEVCWQRKNWETTAPKQTLEASRVLIEAWDLTAHVDKVGWETLLSVDEAEWFLFHFNSSRRESIFKWTKILACFQVCI